MHEVLAYLEMSRGVVYHFVLAFLLGLVAAIIIVWLIKAVAEPLHKLFGGGVIRIMIATLMVGTGIVESFSKYTNDPPRIVQSPDIGHRATTLLPVTSEDISNGWRVAATRDGHALSRLQGGAYTIHEPWLVRGGFDDIAHLSADEWAFPWRNGIADDLIVFSDGTFRLDLSTLYFPCPFDAPLAVVPEFNWSLLPGSVSNVFWHAVTPSNSLIVAWENAPFNHNVNYLTNFQAEFFTDGRFIYHYDDCAVDYMPVLPFDWDDDGLENSVDPDPLITGTDAHGTNAEWYNVICSNVFIAVEGFQGGTMEPSLPTLSPRSEDVNTNAYYFVDVVISRGLAPIYFTGDRESRLGNPIVVARSGETNHVPLLMGINYAVTSTVPFSVSFPDEGFAVAMTNGVPYCEICWPSEFSISPDGTGYRASAGPYDPGCTFQWAEPVRSVTCSYTTDGGWIGFNCNSIGNCECGGCSVAGVATLESASFDLPCVWCGCCQHDSPGSGDGTSQTNTPSISVSFDKAIVFYEGTYTNSPNDVVAKHSTNTILNVSAYGGDAGGMLYISAVNIDKLIRKGGHAISFPYTAFVPPHGDVSFSVEYEAETHSDSEGDISVSASMQPAGGGTQCTASTSVTAVEIIIEAEANFPTNKHRHVFGPAEWIKYTLNPPIAGTTLQGTVPSNGINDPLQGRVLMPFCTSQFTMDVAKGNALFSLPFSVIEPMANLCIDDVRLPSEEDWIQVMNVIPLQEGDIGSAFHVDMSLSPSYVSFAALGIMELYAAATDIQGFFTNAVFNAHLDHDADAGAFRPISVNADNTVGSGDNILFALNNAFIPYLEYGTFKLEIPVVWYLKNTSVTNNLVVLEARNTVYNNADVTVSKYSISVTRGTNDVYTISR